MMLGTTTAIGGAVVESDLHPENAESVWWSVGPSALGL